jgi:hypothetical protein
MLDGRPNTAAWPKALKRRALKVAQRFNDRLPPFVEVRE